jgi:hypothetical protein
VLVHDPGTFEPLVDLVWYQSLSTGFSTRSYIILYMRSRSASVHVCLDFNKEIDKLASEPCEMQYIQSVLV